MIIVFVMDSYDVSKNGTTMTARRFAEYLRLQGHTVRVVSTGLPEQDKYLVPERHIPIVNYFSSRQSFTFAKPDDTILREALTGADVAHLFLPLALEKHAYAIAQEMGIPCSAAFHLQPENITYNIRMGRFTGLNNWIYRLFYHSFYKQFSHIHCPSRFIANQLKQHGYKAKLHVISNGITTDFLPAHQDAGDGLFHILMTGRLSPEKRQDLLIDAVKLSAHRDKIQLHFAGTGPREKFLRRRGEKLPHPPIFGFYPKEQLLELIHHCDLYVHAADAEIEAIACLEAVACGLVPVISDSKQSATSQFALDERGTFRAGDAADLANKINYWIEHPGERALASEAYAQSAQCYRIEECVRAAEQMFQETISDARRS